MAYDAFKGNWTPIEDIEPPEVRTPRTQQDQDDVFSGNWKEVSLEEDLKIQGKERAKSLVRTVFKEGARGLTTGLGKQAGEIISAVGDIAGHIPQRAIAGPTGLIDLAAESAARAILPQQAEPQEPIKDIGGHYLDVMGKKIAKYFEQKGEEIYGKEPGEETPLVERYAGQAAGMLAPSVVPGLVITKGLQAINGIGKVAKAWKAAQGAEKAALGERLAEIIKSAENTASGIVGGMFGLSQYTNSMENAEDRAKELEQAGDVEGAKRIRESALTRIGAGTAGLIEGIGEFYGTKYLSKLFRMPEGELIADKGRNLVKNFFKTMAVETSTEVGQNIGEAEAEAVTGIRPATKRKSPLLQSLGYDKEIRSTLSEGLEAIGPTVGMTLMTMGLAHGAGKVARLRQKKETETDVLTDQQELGFDPTMAKTFIETVYGGEATVDDLEAYRKEVESNTSTARALDHAISQIRADESEHKEIDLIQGEAKQRTGTETSPEKLQKAQEDNQKAIIEQAQAQIQALADASENILSQIQQPLPQPQQVGHVQPVVQPTPTEQIQPVTPMSTQEVGQVQPENVDIFEGNWEPVEPTTIAPELTPIAPTEEKPTEATALASAVEQAAKEAEREPTEAQKEAGNYKKAHVSIQGLDITIENARGSVRRGVDKTGKPWQTRLKNHYGYLRRTVDNTGEQLDVFLGSELTSDKVFVVHQIDPKTGKFDEFKTMLGFTSEPKARMAYLANYERGWKGLGKIEQMGMDQFKAWMKAAKLKPEKRPATTPATVTTPTTELQKEPGRKISAQPTVEQAEIPTEKQPVQKEIAQPPQPKKRLEPVKKPAVEQPKKRLEPVAKQKEREAEEARKAQAEAKEKKPAAEAKPAEKVEPEPKEAKRILSPETKQGRKGNLLVRTKDGTVYESEDTFHAQAEDTFGINLDDVVATGIIDTGGEEIWQHEKTPKKHLFIQPHDSLDQIYKQAEETLPRLTNLTKRYAKAFEGKVELRPGDPLKSRESAERKVRDELKGNARRLTDVAATTITFDSMEDMYEALDAIKADRRITVKVTDRYKKELDSGYRDIIIKIIFDNGHIGELQLNLRKIWWVKEHGPGHVLYEIERKLRPLADAPKRLDVDNETHEEAKRVLAEFLGVSRKLYDAAFSSKDMESAKSMASSLEMVREFARIWPMLSGSVISDRLDKSSLNKLLSLTTKGVPSLSKNVSTEILPPSTQNITPEAEKGKEIKPPPAQIPQKITPGMRAKVYTASAMEGIPVHFGLIEASDIIPSHDPQSFFKRPDYPEGIQEREYHRDKHEQAKVIDHAKHLKTPLLLTNNPDAVNGPPIIMQNGVVLGGNSRAMTLMRAYEDGPMGQKYKTKLAMFANQFGLTASQVEAMNRPILVRITDEVTDDPKELHRLATLFNEPMTQAMSTEAKMVSMGKNVSSDTVQRIGMMMAERDETIRGLLDKKDAALEILRILEADGVITKAQRNKYWNEKRNMMNEEGKRLVEGVLLGNVVDDADLLRDTAASIMQKISRSLADLAKIRGRGGEWDILGHLKLAMELTINAKANGTSIEEFLAQTSFLDRTDYTPKSIVLAKALLDFKPKEWSDSVSGYAKDAHLDIPNQGVLLVTFNTPEESFAEHFGTMSKARTKPAKLRPMPGSISPTERLNLLETSKEISVDTTVFEGIADLSSMREKAREIYKTFGEAKNKNDGKSIRFIMTSFKKMQIHSADVRMLKIVPSLRNLVEEAIPLFESPRKATDPRETERWLQYGVKANIEGESEYVKLTVREDKQGNRYVDFFKDAHVTPANEITKALRDQAYLHAMKGRDLLELSGDKLKQWMAIVKANPSSCDSRMKMTVVTAE